MSSTLLSAGDSIEARCTKCKEVLNHTIVAMVEGKVVRVKCNTCNGMHNYRSVAAKSPAKTASVRKTAVPRAAKKDPGAADLEEWAALRPTMRLDRAVVYDMNGKFRVRDLVDHSTFGYGVVKLIPGPNKMEVLFEGGKKLLRCQ